MLDIIMNTFTPPTKNEPGVDNFKDNRTKLYLLYKETNRIDALLVPFGNNLKGKKDISTYLRFLPDGSCHSTSFQDGEISEFVSSGYKYFTIKDELREFAIPFKTKTEFPSAIMPGFFAQKVASCNENMVKLMVEYLEIAYDVKHGDKSALKILFQTLDNLFKSVVEMYSPLREPVMTEFEDVTCDSKKLGFFDRKVKHYTLNSIEDAFIKMPITKKGLVVKAIKDVLVNEPFKHSFYSTEDNKMWIFRNKKFQNEKAAKTIRALFDYIKKESPKAHEVMTDMCTESGKNGAKYYHAELFLASVASLCTGHFALGIGLFGFYFLESRIAKNNKQKSGYPTGLIGTIRDKTGLTSKYLNPFDLVSDKYDLGIWRRDDLK